VHAQALQEIRIGSSNVSVTNLCTFYARDHQYFQMEGLDAKIIIIKTEATLAALVSNNLGYSTLSTSSIEATLKGLPLRLVTVTNQYPLIGLVVSENITSVSDLKGKKLAVSSFGGAVYGAAIYLLRNFGLRPQQDVTILASGGNVARIAALKQGAVDAALISSPDDIRAMREGFKILLDAGTYFRLPFGGISTTVANIHKNPAEVGRVVRAVVRAVQAMADPRNRDGVITYLVNFFKLERADATEFYTRLIPSLSPTGIVDRDKINLVIDSAVERGLTQKPLDPNHVVDFSFAKSVR
jgi:ABC-type nitrate/sulfonate/bicarbonate transport system substrate-binding protein